MVEKLLTVTVSEKENGDAVVSTKFHRKTSGQQALDSLATGANALIQAAVKIGESCGLTEEQVVGAMFPDRK